MRGAHVGFYVHHHGSGHRHRATALARALAARGVGVTGLSSSPRPDDWPVAAAPTEDDWVQLDRDDDPRPGPEADVTAGGHLHWAPLRHRGARRRTAQLSAWLEASRPDLVVTDVSQEVSLLVRLHGVPVVSVVLPGRRDDAPHALGLGVSSEVVGFWPPRARDTISTGLPADVAARVRSLGGQSRFAPASVAAPAADRRTARARHLVVLAGTGGGAELLEDAAASALRDLDGWTCQVVGGSAGWVAEPAALLREATVVLTHAGQNAVAEVAAARVPAVVVPLARPFDEQIHTGLALADGPWPAVVAAPETQNPTWATAVRRAADLDGATWESWVDGGAAERFADVVADLLAGVLPGAGDRAAP